MRAMKHIKRKSKAGSITLSGFNIWEGHKKGGKMEGEIREEYICNMYGEIEREE